MSKYSFEFKKKIVLAYVNGEGSHDFLAKKYGVLAASNIKNWIQCVWR